MCFSCCKDFLVSDKIANFCIFFSLPDSANKAFMEGALTLLLFAYVAFFFIFLKLLIQDKGEDRADDTHNINISNPTST